jgi:hypothetical protein
MGVSQGITMHFHLDSLITPREDLQYLIEPIEEEEINNIVRKMHVDKAPGPDGFNGLIFKKCWPIVKHEFYNLCRDFFDGRANIEGINKYFITLIPKTNNPETVNDYRPISLMNICPKIFSKIMADRLQMKIIILVH